ncbi:MAG TPA: hypothetical protein VFS41_05555, partial [Edaphobacter sp.]|nr:hypothetical protein [Edaphobacter sp.]
RPATATSLSTDRTGSEDGRAKVKQAVNGALLFMADGSTRELIEESARLTVDGSIDGQFHVKDDLHDIRGSVTCFTIEDEEVRIAGQVRESNSPYVAAGTYLAWTQVDNDARAKNDATKGGRPRTPDMTSQVVLADAGLASLQCATGLNLPLLPAIAGAVEIHPESHR